METINSFSLVMPRQLFARDRKIFRWNRDDLNLTSRWCDDPQAFGVQRQSLDQRAFGFAFFNAIVSFELAEENSRRPGVVDRIDRQRQADGGQMHADLMGLAGFGENSQEREMTEALLDFPKRSRRSAAVFDDRHSFFDRRMRADGRVDFALVCFGTSNNQGEIFLLHGVVLELMGKKSLNGGVPREDHHAGGVLVKAMDHEHFLIELG